MRSTFLSMSGSQPAWNDVGQSVGHRVIPLPSEEAVERLPMIAQLLRQLGIVTVAQLSTLPRNRLDLRFGSEVLTRWDQARGMAEEIKWRIELPRRWKRSWCWNTPPDGAT